jgi:alpha-tubulin suppressor-like RCC1 family protein
VNVTARAVAGGGAHTCAITTANHARCWGANDLGQLGTNITATAVGDVAGEMSTLQESELGTRRIFQVVAGADHTCAILGSASPGPVKCWGYNGDGALGIGNTLDRGDEPNEMGTNLPTLALGTGRNAKWLAAGDGHTCAVLDNNTLKCWGRNDMGQEGMGDFTTRLSPSTSTVNLGSLRTAHATVAFPVAAGHEHTCIILDNSTVKCWGENTDGQLGYGDTTLRTAPDANAINLGTGLTAKAIATGVSYTCALLSNNTVKCWGRNDDGQLGYGDTAIRLSPPATSVNLGTGRTAKAIATGGTTTCAILDNNTVKCWGYNGSAQLGLGDTTPRLSPSSTAIDLGSGQTALSIDVGSQHVCVVLATNQVKCWGQNASGQLGTWQEMFDNFDTTIGERANEMGNFLAMVYQGAGRAVKAVTTGFAHTCFLLDSNQVRCTGTNFNGQLGQGNTNGYDPKFLGAGLVDLGPNP